MKEGVRLLHTVAILFLGAFVVKRGGTRDTNGWDVKIVQWITVFKYLIIVMHCKANIVPKSPTFVPFIFYEGVG